MLEEELAKIRAEYGDDRYDNPPSSQVGVTVTVIYDRDKVKAQDVPKRWADLTDPKWQGKLVSQAF